MNNKMLKLKDYILIASIHFDNKFVEVVSYSKIDIYQNDQLFETLETPEEEDITNSMILFDNTKYSIAFESKMLFDIYVYENKICKITPKDTKEFKIYNDTYIYYNSGKIIFGYKEN